jgi:dihydroorotate dehydrogenase electron transfer subunit
MDAFARLTPGQFILLDISSVGLPEQIPPELAEKANRHILLRRPFSPMAVRSTATGVELELMYKVVGPATVRMTSLRPGQSIQVLGPLGKGFSVLSTMKKAILVAGGIGLPPIYHLAQIIRSDHGHIMVEVFLGIRSASELPLDLDDCGQVDWALDIPVHLTSNDGGIGIKGLITDCLQDWLRTRPPQDLDGMIIFGCGPEPMLRQLARIASNNGIACQISLERYMACGTGLCQGCVVRCRQAGGPVYRLCCQDGPVFDAAEVLFDDHRA